ncbi:MAG: hypothetical protein LBG66_05235 [Gallionellaceae bacterium]|nr:hypothetical protein [Gallionellaceae bacterium]
MSGIGLMKHQKMTGPWLLSERTRQMTSIGFFEKVKFLPFIGENYLSQNKRILLIGESHYGTGDEYKKSSNTFTIDTVNYYLQNKISGFFDDIITTIFGNSENKAEKYNRIAFSNYIQEFVGIEARESSPTAAMWKKSHEPFEELVCKLNPDIIIFFCFCAWDKSSPGICERKGNYEEKIISNDIEILTFSYYTDKKIPTYGLPHPTATRTANGKFNAGKYHKALVEKVPGIAEFLKGT